MSVSRRSFVKSVGAGGAGALLAPFITARGQEALAGEVAAAWPADLANELRLAAPAAIKLDSNENPNGPCAASLEAVRSNLLGGSSRYPGRWVEALRQGLAASLDLPPENLLPGCGSGEILRMTVYAFTSPTRPLVTGAPSFEDPTHHAATIGSPVVAVPVDAQLRLDLAGMAEAARGAGLVFLCNPNNPTGTVHGAGAVQDFVRRVLRASPETTVLIDEAYHEYVEDPTYATAIPLAMENPRVVVCRTFSKVHGMAGLRVGYAIGHPETLKAMDRHRLRNAVNVLGASAALASLAERDHIERERRLNREAREFTRRGFENIGYRVGPSEANFLMVDVRRDSRDFQAACRRYDVLVGRPFPPLTTHARISIGTMEEMQLAVEIFRKVLREG